MPTERSNAIRALLVEAEQAHGVYEATELNGVYDQEWPRWYARYLVEHGLGEMLGHDVDADELAASLAAGYADFEHVDPKPTASWADYLARRIASEL